VEIKSNAPLLTIKAAHLFIRRIISRVSNPYLGGSFLPSSDPNVVFFSFPRLTDLVVLAETFGLPEFFAWGAAAFILLLPNILNNKSLPLDSPLPDLSDRLSSDK